MRRLLIGLLLPLSLHAAADEGMWMISNLSARTDSALHALGLELTREEIYSTEHPCLNDAIVQFGGFCSGVVVSGEGLVFTNHHCGFGPIQGHSSVSHDYLREGFAAKRQRDELPNEDLYVDFHLGTSDVTEHLLAYVSPGMSLERRSAVIDSVAGVLCASMEDTLSAIHAVIVPYYKGSKYYMSLYQRYSDVRLVFAPPQCLGKHGGDTDNWMWPRQTCDFSVFRVYMSPEGRPAAYDERNVPLRPRRWAAVSTRGYEPGSFCMTFGYPGSTDRYLSSYGVEQTMRTTNALRESVRRVKLGVLGEAMGSSDALRIMYAAKYAQSSNYYKFSIGQNKALRDLGVVAEKQAEERRIMDWAAASPGRAALYAGLADSLRRGYAAGFVTAFEQRLWQEAFYSGSDILAFAIRTMVRGHADEPGAFARSVEKTFKDIDVATDRRVFAALLADYLRQAPDSAYVPDFARRLRTAGDIEAFADSVYSSSVFTRPADLMQAETLADIKDDAMVRVAEDCIAVLMSTYRADGSERLKEWERLLGDARREMEREREYYPDANFTLRLSYGQVGGYDETGYSTDVASLLKKYDTRAGNADYDLTPPVERWMRRGRWDRRFADARDGARRLCFLTNNDITGGNSGSGMFDARGRLIGLAFDGNWEAMSGDLKFDNRLQRTIGVDIRYVLAVINDYSPCRRLIRELTLE